MQIQDVLSNTACFNRFKDIFSVVYVIGTFWKILGINIVWEKCLIQV